MHMHTIRTYDAIKPLNAKTLDCSTDNCICLILNANCNMSVNGSDTKDCFSKHRQGMKDLKKDHMCERLGVHFNSGFFQNSYTYFFIRNLKNGFVAEVS